MTRKRRTQTPAQRRALASVLLLQREYLRAREVAQTAETYFLSVAAAMSACVHAANAIDAMRVFDTDEGT